ncbi:MAG: CRISPR-associated protein [Elainellaceae cyanobacterium]
MTSKRNSILEAISDPTKNFLATFLISTLLFSLIADGVSVLFWGNFSDWLQTQLGIASKNQLQGYILLVLVILVLFLIYSTNLAQRLRTLLMKWRIFGTEIPDRASVVPLKRTSPGLIVLMSTRDDSPAEFAIRHHWNRGQPPHLQHCWVICTKSSEDYAKKMKQRLLADGIDENQLHLYYGSYKLNDPSQPGLTLTMSDRDADDPDTILNLVNAIFLDAQSKGLDESDILVDFTGGTKPMGVGTVLACAAPARRLEYLAQTQPPQLMEVRVSYKVKPVR